MRFGGKVASQTCLSLPSDKGYGFRGWPVSILIVRRLIPLERHLEILKNAQNCDADLPIGHVRKSITSPATSVVTVGTPGQACASPSKGAPEPSAGAAMPFQFGLDKARMHDSAEIIYISRRILAFKASGLTTGPIFPVSLKVPLGRFGGGFFWQRFECKKASRWKMRCAGSSGRYSRRTSSRKSSVTPTT